jgi:acyl-CoA synthetase (AMP-forming)/AMP-acid ligase II
LSEVFLPEMTLREGDLITAHLERWADERAAQCALIVLQNGESELCRVTFAELHRSALAVADALAPLGVAGRPVLVLPRQPLDFVVAFLGCLYAGGVAVPSSSGPRKRGWERIAAIVADAMPAAALGNGEVSDLLQAVQAMGVPVYSVSGCTPGPRIPGVSASPDAAALIQYTSGSTGAPKGVVITHRNLASNLRMIRSSFAVRDETVYLTWLPLFHDMGLIGNLLSAIYCGVPCVLMSPLSFYQRPQRWLSAISRYGATISGGPNFGYELCFRRSSRMDLAGVDLSRWEIAFCGAELVRPSTMRSFDGAFAKAGFRSSAFYSCYGLAEATVFVTGSERNAGLKTAPDGNGVEVVSCGRAPPGERLVIVDPDKAAPLPEGEIGEIWVSGDNVAAGYWKKPEETDVIFRARLRGCETSAFMRTGDLGWLRNGELYFSGRLKDLIVSHGLSIHAEDIERTAAESHPAFGEMNAAFSIETGNEEQIVVIQELARPYPADLNYAAILTVLSQAVANAHGIRLHDAVLVRSGSVPRTTSGKVQRSRCRELYCNQALRHTSFAAILGFV